MSSSGLKVKPLNVKSIEDSKHRLGEKSLPCTGLMNY